MSSSGVYAHKGPQSFPRMRNMCEYPLARGSVGRHTDYSHCWLLQNRHHPQIRNKEHVSRVRKRRMYFNLITCIRNIELLLRVGLIRDA